MLKIHSFRGSNEQLFEKLKGLFGQEKVKYDKNLVFVSVTEIEFVSKYKEPCILRFNGIEDLIAVSPNDGKFFQR